MVHHIYHYHCNMVKFWVWMHVLCYTCSVMWVEELQLRSPLINFSPLLHLQHIPLSNSCSTMLLAGWVLIGSTLQFTLGLRAQIYSRQTKRSPSQIRPMTSWWPGGEEQETNQEIGPPFWQLWRAQDWLTLPMKYRETLRVVLYEYR